MKEREDTTNKQTPGERKRRRGKGRETKTMVVKGCVLCVVCEGGSRVVWWWCGFFETRERGERGGPERWPTPKNQKPKKNTTTSKEGQKERKMGEENRERGIEKRKEEEKGKEERTQDHKPHTTTTTPSKSTTTPTTHPKKQKP